MLKRPFLPIGLFVSSVWHFVLRCFYYFVIFVYRLISWISAPLIRTYKATSPVFLERFQSFILLKDSFLHSPMGRIPAVAMIGAFTAFILSINYFGLGLEVYIDGESVGFVSNQQEIDSVIHSVENRSAFYLNHPYNLNIDVEYKLKLMDQADVINPVKLEETLFSKVNEISTLYVLTIDGTIIGANASKTAIETVLGKILEQYGSKEPNIKTEFVQDVEIQEMPVANVYLNQHPSSRQCSKGARVLKKRKLTPYKTATL